MDALLFMIFAAIAVVCGISLVIQRHPISSALSLVGVMGALAALYLLLGGAFIAAAQMVVYAGAIMVLFIFVIMLLNSGTELRGVRTWAVWAGLPMLVLLLGMIAHMLSSWEPARQAVIFGEFTGGGPAEIGRSLFTTYLLPFEVTSVLILIAIVGAIVLARKEID